MFLDKHSTDQLVYDNFEITLINSFAVLYHDERIIQYETINLWFERLIYYLYQV